MFFVVVFKGEGVVYLSGTHRLDARLTEVDEAWTHNSSGECCWSLELKMGCEFPVELVLGLLAEADEVQTGRKCIWLKATT